MGRSSGINLFHFKATSAPHPDRVGWTIRVDDLDAEAMRADRFESYCRTIHHVEWPCRFLIAADNLSLNFALTKMEPGGRDLLSCFVGEPRKFLDEIVSIERLHGLDALRRKADPLYGTIDPEIGPVAFGYHDTFNEEDLRGFSWKTPEHVLNHLSLVAEHDNPAVMAYLTIRYPKQADYLGFTTEIVGYQEGEVKSNFDDVFVSPFVRWRRADVEQALGFIGRRYCDDPEMDRHLRKRFARNFLDHFEEGRSIFAGGFGGLSREQRSFFESINNMSIFDDIE